MNNSTPGMNELLVDYLDGTLSTTDKETVEQQLATDTILQQQYDSLLITREAIRQYGLQQKVAGLHQQMMNELQAPVKKMRPANRKLRYALSMAASVILLVGGFILYNFIGQSSEKVYSANHIPFTLSNARDGGTAITPIEEAYNNKDYKEVIRIYDSKEEVSAKGCFLAGASSLEMSNNSKAINYFKKTIEINKAATVSVWNDDAEYFLAMAYIRNRDYDFALDMLNKIQDNPDHLYHEKITGKLIRQVKMLKWR
jgi:tetratricopeptide (TPR) repeat protein